MTPVCRHHRHRTCRLPYRRLRRAKIDAPPAPPVPTWVINTYQWLNGGWVKQPDHCLKTPSIKQAADYCLELSRFPGWYYQTNVPLSCCDPAVKANAEVPSYAHPRRLSEFDPQCLGVQIRGRQMGQGQKVLLDSQRFPHHAVGHDKLCKAAQRDSRLVRHDQRSQSVRGNPLANATAPPVPGGK